MVESVFPNAPPVLERLKDYISTAGMPCGARLPPERHLCDELGVTRAELRKALAVLEINGLLERKVGIGTFLSEVPEAAETSAVQSPFDDLAERISPHDAMVARLTMEPELASLAAIHATPRQLSAARRLADGMRTAKDWQTYEQLDAEFHALIAEASGNALLNELFKVVNAVRLAVVWKRLDVPPDGPPEGYHSFTEHDAILDALERRDRGSAHRAMRNHLQSIISDMHSEDR